MQMKAISIKFVISTVVLLGILPIFRNASLPEIIITSLLLTILSYIIGDLFILRKFNNLVAAVADLVLIGATLWFLNMFFIGASTEVLFATIAAATFITLGESLFHMFLKERIFPRTQNDSARDRTTSYSTGRLQTEFAEENDIHDVKTKK